MTWRNVREDVEEMFNQLSVPDRLDLTPENGYTVNYWDWAAKYEAQGGANYSRVRVGNRSPRAWTRRLTEEEVSAKKSAAGKKTGALMRVKKPNAKLTWEKVAVIRDEWAAKVGWSVTKQKLADKYGVSLECIKNVVSGKQWKEESNV